MDGIMSNLHENNTLLKSHEMDNNILNYMKVI